MKKLILLLFSIVTLSSYAETKLQIIHNSADAIAASVDIYVNGSIYEDNLNFRNATEFRVVPSGVELSIDVAPSSSTSSAESIFNVKVTLADGKDYIAIANGIVSASGYSPAEPFKIHVYDMAMQTAPEGKTNVMVFHGATDAPVVDIVETAVPAGTIVNDMAYGDFTGYLELGTLDYILDVRDQTGATTVVSYAAPLQTLNLRGSALVALASGFLAPASNSDGPAFGVYVALPAGGALIPLPVHTYDMAKAQVIHNSADAVATNVDVYINGEKAIDNFAFRTATPFLDLRAGVPTVIDIAPATSANVSESIYNLTATLEKDKSYSLIANGIVSASGYSPAEPFKIHVYDMAMETAPEGKTNVMVFHGATDAPVVDIVETAVPAGTIVNDMAYGDFTGYLELGTLDYILDVRDQTGATTVVSYAAPLQTLNLGGSALVALASGFLAPASNSDGPAFGVYVALPAGGALIPLPLATATSNVNIKSVSNNIITYPNPVLSSVVIRSDELMNNISVYDVAGKEILSQGVNSYEKSLNVESLKSGNYFLVVSDKNKNQTVKQIIKQ